MEITDDVVKECATILKQLDFFRQELKTRNIAHDCRTLCERCSIFTNLVTQLVQYPAMLSEFAEMSLIKELSIFLLNILNFVQQTLDKYELFANNLTTSDHQSYGLGSNITAVFGQLLDFHQRQGHIKDLAKLNRQFKGLAEKLNVNEDFDFEQRRSEDLSDLQTSFKEMSILILNEIMNTSLFQSDLGGHPTDHLTSFQTLQQALLILPDEIAQYLVLMKYRPLSVVENKKVKSNLLLISSMIEKKRNEFTSVINSIAEADPSDTDKDERLLQVPQPKLLPHLVRPGLPKMSTPYLLKILGHPLIISREEEVRKNKIIGDSLLPIDSLDLMSNNDAMFFQHHYAEQYCSGMFNPAVIKLATSQHNLLQPKLSTLSKEKMLIKLIQDDVSPLPNANALLPKYLENEILLLQYLQQGSVSTTASSPSASQYFYHPNLLTFYGYAINKPFYYLVFESTYYGNLQSFLLNYLQYQQHLHQQELLISQPQSLQTNSKGDKKKTSNTFQFQNDLPLALILAWMHDIINGLNFLHQQNIIHGNLMTQNIYLTQSFRCKISDFAIAQQVISKERPKAENAKPMSMNVAAFIAPEIRLGNTMESTADIFSFAMICLHLLSFSIPVIESLQDQIRIAVYQFILPYQRVRHQQSNLKKYEHLSHALSKLQGLLLDCSMFDMETSISQLRPTSDVIKEQLQKLIEVMGGDVRKVEVASAPSDEQKSVNSPPLQHLEEEEWKEFLFHVQGMMKNDRKPSVVSNASSPASASVRYGNKFPNRFLKPTLSVSKSRSVETDRETLDDDAQIEDDMRMTLLESIEELHEFDDLESLHLSDVDEEEDNVIVGNERSVKPRDQVSKRLEPMESDHNLDDIYQVHEEITESVLVRSASLTVSEGKEHLVPSLSVRKMMSPLSEQTEKKDSSASSSRFNSYKSSSPSEVTSEEYQGTLSKNFNRFPSINAIIEAKAMHTDVTPSQILKVQPNAGKDKTSILKEPVATSSPYKVMPGQKLTETMVKKPVSTPKPELTSTNLLAAFSGSDQRLLLIKFFREKGLCLQSNSERYADILIKNGIPTVQDLQAAVLKDEKFLARLKFDANDVMEINDQIYGAMTLDSSSSASALTDSVFNIPMTNIGRQTAAAKPSGRSPPALYPSLSLYRSDRSVTNSASPIITPPAGQFAPWNEANAFSPNYDVSPQHIRGRTTNSSVGGNSLDALFVHTSNQQPLHHLNDSFLPSDVSTIYYRAAQCYDPIATTKLFDAAASGDVLAEGYVMRMYVLGQGGVQQNLRAAQKIGFRIIEELRSLTHSTIKYISLNAQFLLGVCASEGLGMPKDEREGYWWYHDSAQQGFSIAQAFLGFCYYTGMGVTKDWSQAVKWYNVAAAQGHASAQTNLGLCYEYGHGVAQNACEAVKWYRLAAAQGDIAAEYNLAYCYERGVGITQDLKKALQYYEAAAARGHPAAQCNLGCFFEKGAVVQMDHFTAFRWFYSSAMKGYPPAQCKVGQCFEYGVGVQYNPVTAVDWYQKSVDSGYSQGMYHLGFCYSTGLGVDQPDIEKALALYERASEKGNAAAQNNLAYFYKKGYGVRQNMTMAIRLYRAAAQQGKRFVEPFLLTPSYMVCFILGYPAAQYNLAYCYEKGLGVQKKLHEVVKWYRLASENGVEKATIALNRLTRSSWGKN